MLLVSTPMPWATEPPQAVTRPRPDGKPPITDTHMAHGHATSKLVHSRVAEVTSGRQARRASQHASPRAKGRIVETPPAVQARAGTTSVNGGSKGARCAHKRNDRHVLRLRLSASPRRTQLMCQHNTKFRNSHGFRESLRILARRSPEPKSTALAARRARRWRRGLRRACSPSCTTLGMSASPCSLAP